VRTLDPLERVPHTAAPSLPDLPLFREQLATFLDAELTEEIRRQQPMDGGLGPAARRFALKLGATGWLGAGWPQRYGGSGGTIAYEIVLAQEFAKRGAMVPNIVARFMAGPVLLRYGTEALKQAFLPRICRGEIEFALGYTEPQAGSDLAALTMRAVDHGDHYRISGQKIYQTESHYADYHWLAARTDTASTGHGGISLFVVDQRAAGISIHPMETLGGERTSTVFYDEVEVPKERLVGTSGRGFYHLMEALDFERVMMLQNLSLVPVLHRLVAHTRMAKRGGRALSADAGVRRRLAQMSVEIEAALCLERHAQGLLERGEPLDYMASLVKLFGSEVRQRLGYAGLDTLGPAGRLDRDSTDAPLAGEFAHIARSSVVDTIGAGTSEVLRNVIATRGLGLPRS
jgi:hypothetical protein